MEFEREENLMLEEAENTEEQTVEETVEGEESTAAEETETQPRTYTDEELNQRVDELLRPKIARGKAKAEKELREEYRDYLELADVVSAGLGTEDVKQSIKSLREFYEEKGVKIPEYHEKEKYNERELKILADYEADDIIKSGLDEVEEETDRLAAKGIDKMTAKEKFIFARLAEYRQAESGRQELLSIGAKREIIDSNEYKTFASKFNASTPAKDIYSLYQKTLALEEPPAEKIGSLKNGNSTEEKEYYTPDEVDKLTEEEFSNPKILKRVRESMFKW